MDLSFFFQDPPQTTPSRQKKASLLLDSQCQLGECILYDTVSQSILWTDILGKRFHALQIAQPSQAIHQVYQLPKKLASFGLLKKSSNDASSSSSSSSLPLLCAWEDGFQLVDLINGTALSDYSQGPNVNPLQAPTRLNDGRTHPQGHVFVCGGYHGGHDTHQDMQVFGVQQQQPGSLSHSVIYEPIHCTNSICFQQPDGNIMYMADSPKKFIQPVVFDTSTNNKKNIVVLDSIENHVFDNEELLDYTQFHHDKEAILTHANPDGSTTDAQGYLWNAVWRTHPNFTGLVHKIHPTSGQVVDKIHLSNSVSQASCCCFIPRNPHETDESQLIFDRMVISTAREDLTEQVIAEQQPHAGGIFGYVFGEDASNNHHHGNRRKKKIHSTQKKTIDRGLPEARLEFQW